MSNQMAIDHALNTIKEIRGIINNAQGTINPEQEKRRLVLALIIHCGALLFGLFFWVGEMLTGQVTADFARSAVDGSFRTQGLVSLACGLLFLVAALYSVIRYEAKNSEESLKNFVNQNFPTLLTLNFFSDLLVKYAAVSVVVLASKPEFVAPLLLVFLADYLLQRRFFMLPFKINLIAAIAFLGIAVSQVFNANPSLFYALSAFCLLTVGSVIYISSGLIGLKQQKEV